MSGLRETATLALREATAEERVLANASRSCTIIGRFKLPGNGPNERFCSDRRVEGLDVCLDHARDLGLEIPRGAEEKEQR